MKKPRFKVGQVMLCKRLKLFDPYGKILERRMNKNSLRSPEGYSVSQWEYRFGNDVWDGEKDLRPLTKRERGDAGGSK